MTWIAYERVRLRTELTRISRFLSATVAPHTALTREEEWIKLVLGRLNVVQTALNPVNKPGCAPPLPLGHRRRRMGAHRAVIAGARLSDPHGRPSGEASPP
jgi:hypothetical protein